MNYNDWKSYWEDVYTEGNNVEWEPSTPQDQDEADALAAIEDAPDPEEPTIYDLYPDAPF